VVALISTLSVYALKETSRADIVAPAEPFVKSVRPAAG
jgi:hypothetical protein